MTRVPSAPTANRMGHIRAKGNSAEPLTANRLLLNVDGLSITVVTPDMDRARAASWTYSIACHISIPRNHEYIIAQGLKVVGDAIPRNFTPIVQIWSFDVRLLRQVASETTRIPRTVTSDAIHVLVVVSTV